ncbi:hypothetical protein MY10362_001473 [Beauveria mimosiformis]
MGDSSVATVNRALARMNMNRDAKRLVVAIDFGTTYSGIAYCFPDLSPDGKLTAIRRWPGMYFMDAIHSRDILTEKSVPAVWSDAAKNATLEAAKAAGISPVTLIKEPEAAALYSIRQLDVFLAPGDIIVICDAGGGTVDLISYEIEKVSPTLELREIVPGTGTARGFGNRDSADASS